MSGWVGAAWAAVAFFLAAFSVASVALLLRSWDRGEFDDEEDWEEWT